MGSSSRGARVPILLYLSCLFIPQYSASTDALDQGKQLRYGELLESSNSLSSQDSFYLITIVQIHLSWEYGITIHGFKTETILQSSAQCGLQTETPQSSTISLKNSHPLGHAICNTRNFSEL
ncbi:hypothetical protein SLA2020_102810 [Shorea laevis]